MRTNEDLPAITAVFLVGMVLPLAAALAVHDVLSLYLAGRQFTVLCGAAFALLAWVLLAAVDPDRVNVLVASFVMP